MEFKKCKQCAEYKPIEHFGKADDLPCATCTSLNIHERLNMQTGNTRVIHTMTIQEHYKVISCLRDIRDKAYTDIVLEARIQVERAIFLQSVKESTSMTKIEKLQAMDLDKHAEVLYKRNKAYWIKKIEQKLIAEYRSEGHTIKEATELAKSKAYWAKLASKEEDT